MALAENQLKIEPSRNPAVFAHDETPVVTCEATLSAPPTCQRTRQRSSRCLSRRLETQPTRTVRLFPNPEELSEKENFCSSRFHEGDKMFRGFFFAPRRKVSR